MDKGPAPTDLNESSMLDDFYKVNRLPYLLMSKVD